MKSLFLLTLLSLPLSALATNKPTEPVTPATPAVTVVQASESNSLAAAAARSASRSSATADSDSRSGAAATNGSVTGTTGPSISDADATGGAGVGSVDIGGDTTIYPRQLPPIIQAMLVRSGCGAGFGLAGGDGKGQGAAQAVFTSDQCYALQSVGLSIALGDWRGACERLAYVNRDADRKMGYKPDCVAFALQLEAEAKAAAKAAAQPALPDLSRYATHDEAKRYASEAATASFKASVKK